MRLILVFTILLNGSALMANLSVFFTRGQVWRLQKSGSTKVLLKAGDVLNHNALLKIASRGEVILMNSHKQFALLRDTSKQYTYDELVNLVQKSKEGSLFENLKKELGKGLGQHLSSEEIIRLYSSETGGVIRSDCYIMAVNYPANNSVIPASKVLFDWSPSDTSYKIQIDTEPFIDFRSSVIVDRRLNDTIYRPDINELNRICHAGTIKWKVSKFMKESCLYNEVKVISDSAYRHMLFTIDNQISAIDDEFYRALRKVTLLEEAGLIEEARNSYSELLLLNNNEQLKELYQLFLWRNGLK